MRLQWRKKARLEDKWDFFFPLFLVLVYSIPLLSQIKTKVHSNLFLFPGRTATWQLRKMLNPINNCNLSPRLLPCSRNVPSGLGFQITPLQLISEGSLLPLPEISYLLVCVDLKNGHADWKKSQHNNKHFPQKSYCVRQSPFWCAYISKIITEHGTGFLRDMSCCGGWVDGGFGREKQEQKGLEIEIKLLLKPRWEGKTVEEVWWDQTVMRLDI